MTLSTVPDDGFAIVSGPGNFYTGAAVGFIPPSNGSLESVNLLLKGYDGQKGQEIYCQFCESDSNDQPLSGLNFICPAPNNGSLTFFSFRLAAPANLIAARLYWIFIYGKLNATNMVHGTKLNWVTGGNPVGEIAYKKSMQFVLSGFQPSSIRPAFTLNVIDA